MIAVVDYGVGNLFSLQSSLKSLRQEAVVTSDPGMIRSAERIILPGVGAFGDAAEKLRLTGLDRIVLEQAEKGKPLLGICLGMQMLFEKSYEFGEHRGLGLLRGSVIRGIEDSSDGLEFSDDQAKPPPPSIREGRGLRLFCSFILCH